MLDHYTSLPYMSMLSGFSHRADARCFLSGIRRARRCPCELHPCPKIFPGILRLDAVILMTRTGDTKSELFRIFFQTCPFFMKEMEASWISYKRKLPSPDKVSSFQKRTEIIYATFTIQIWVAFRPLPEELPHTWMCCPAARSAAVAADISALAPPS